MQIQAWIILFTTTFVTASTRYFYSSPIDTSHRYFIPEQEQRLVGRQSRRLPIWNKYHPLQSNLQQIELEFPEQFAEDAIVSPRYQYTKRPLSNSFELLHMFDGVGDVSEYSHGEPLKSTDSAAPSQTIVTSITSSFPSLSPDLHNNPYVNPTLFSQRQPEPEQQIEKVKVKSKKSKCRTWTSPEGIQFLLRNSEPFKNKMRLSRHLEFRQEQENFECEPESQNPHMKFSPPYYSPGSASEYVNI